MASGGARYRSGPAPDPNAARRDRKDDVSGWTILPATGRPGPAPAWPLLDMSPREATLWGSFWAKPQAVIWERDNLVEFVALFVRQFAEGEIPKSSAENRKTIRMMLADLYLTPDALARARYRIEEPVAPSTGRSFRKGVTSSHLAVVVPPSDV
jgi:hypothetical protein